ncbi:MAG: GNAT family N-acetyltransferase [Acidobacteriota bacterium]
MEITSLALATELALAQTRGTVVDRGGYIRVETPDEPGWSDGNLLALPHAPAPADVPRWIDTFRHELGEHRAVSLRWDEPTGERYAELEVDTYELMLAGEVLAPPHSLPTRELAPDELALTAELAFAIGDRHDDAYHQFLRRRARWHEQLVGELGARFFGAFDRDQLVASLGLVPLGAVARYQDVQTSATHRRRGLAGSLLATAARAFPQVSRFAILAEAGSDATRVYTRVGFTMRERCARAYTTRRTS